MNLLTVLVADDDPVFLRALTRFLREQQPHGLVLMEAAASGDGCARQAQAMQPRLILLGIGGGLAPAWDVVADVRRAAPNAALLVLLHSDEQRKAALAAGADDFVAKSRLETGLAPALSRLLGTPWPPPADPE